MPKKQTANNQVGVGHLSLKQTAAQLNAIPKRNSHLYDLATLLQAGIDPKTGLPIKLGGDSTGDLKPDILRALDIKDRQDAIHRYKWFNLPVNMSSRELETMLYYRSQLCFFYLEELDSFYFLPYTLDGTIDLLCRYNTIRPVPMATAEELGKKRYKYINKFFEKKKYQVIYSPVDPDDLTLNHLLKGAVILRDYANGISQHTLPRVAINEVFRNIQADVLPFLRTALIAGTGVKAMKTDSADTYREIESASRQLIKYARSGKLWIPVDALSEIQELADGNIAKVEEYLVAFQSLDNIRRSMLGIQNGGAFEKKTQVLQAEQDVNNVQNEPQYDDGLEIRQDFCNIVNSVWNLGIVCLPNNQGTQEQHNVAQEQSYNNNDNNSGGDDNGVGH